MNIRNQLGVKRLKLINLYISIVSTLKSHTEGGKDEGGRGVGSAGKEGKKRECHNIRNIKKHKSHRNHGTGAGETK